MKPRPFFPILILGTLGFLASPTAAQERPVSVPLPAFEGRIFFLDFDGTVYSANPDGSGLKAVIAGLTGSPDGIDVDEVSGRVYWSTMGRARDDDGSIQRVDADGRNLSWVVPRGGTFTAKQMKLDRRNGKLYWSDREGMRVMRANVDGSHIETLVEVARGDEARTNEANWCVGLAIDVAGGKIYWSQKGPDNGHVGSIRSANLEIPKGETAATRTDIEVLFENLPEPIDLELDLERRMIYWTDRGDAPAGNNVSRAALDLPEHTTAATRKDREIVLHGLDEGIGIALDLANDRMFVTDFSGNLYSARLDGSQRTVLHTGLGRLTGIAYSSR